MSSLAGGVFVPKSIKLADVGLVAMVVAIVALMVIPIPLFVLDSLIAINIMVSVTLLMLSAYVPSALSLSTFPSLLLFTTLLRLSLNIASTKNILLHADGGHIIQTFGHLVMGGNLVVGLVVFVITAIVQFVVIAKGSERVAEVSARFTLDAMPGKQMSIDADLRAGLLSKDDARMKRKTLERESQLHGAMDGAMKFVKGDAIAGLIIAAVNMLGGIAVGVLIHDMSATVAASKFVLLSIGDGMVSQIPSLFVSIAAGVLITRVGENEEGKSDLSKDIATQFVSQPIALAFTGFVMLLFVVVPGFPWATFLGLGVILLLMSRVLRRRSLRPTDVRATPSRAMARDGYTGSVPFIQTRTSAITVPLVLEIHPDTLPNLDPILFEAKLAAARADARHKLGLPFPGMQIRANAELPSDAVRLLVNEVPVASTSVQWQRTFSSATPLSMDRSSPLDSFAGEWRERDMTNTELPHDYAPEALIALMTGRALMRFGDRFIGLQETQWLLREAGEDLPDLVEEVSRALPLQRIADVLRRLVQEGISIRHLREILESLITWGPKEKDIVMLVEYVRVDLGRTTAFDIAHGETQIGACIIDHAIEERIRGAVQQSVAGAYLALPTEKTDEIAEAVRRAVMPIESQLPVVCSMDIRRFLSKLLDQAGLPIRVLSYQELGPHLHIYMHSSATL